MKRLILFIGLLITACGAVITAREVKVMTYNLHNGVGLDKKRDHARLAEIIRLQKPDYVAVQEADSATRRSGNAYVLGEIAASAGMYPVYAPAIDFDGGRYGIGILSREVPDSVTRIPLPGREESRMLVVAWFKDVVIADTHLSLTPEDALASVDIIREIVKSTTLPIILMGDLNSLPDSPVIKELEQNFTILSPAEPTFPANAPTEQIDYIMLSCGTNFHLLDTSVLPEPVASDHRPVTATVEF